MFGLTGVVPSAIGVIVSLILLVFLVMKGMHLIPTAVICAIFLSFFVEGGLINGLFNIFSGGFGNLAIGYLMPYMCAGFFSGLMSASGSDVSFGQTIVSKFGKRFSIYGLGLFVGVLAFCGVNSFPVLAAILAFTLLKASDLPREIGVLILCVCGSAFMFLLPGSPSRVSAVMVSLVPGINIFAGSWIAVVMALVQLVLGYAFIELYVIPKFRREGIGYTETPTEQALRGQFMTMSDEDLPSFFVSCVPMIVIIAVVFILQLVVGVEAFPAVCIGLLLGSLTILALNWKRLKGKIIKSISNGCETSCVPMIMVCIIAGFGSLVSSTSAYNAMIAWVTNLDINPYILAAVGTALLAGVCGDSASGLVISAQSIIPNAIAMGGNPGMVARLSMAACTTLDSLPHSSNIAAYIAFMGCTHKSVYKYCAVIQIGITSVMTAIGCILMMIFY